MDRFSGLAACTVVSKNHLAYARVVCESFLRHHPGARFFVLLCDRNVGEIDPARERFDLVELQGLSIPDLPRFCFQYNILELNCAGKPYLLRYVLAQPGISRVLYLDSDTFVYREMTEVLALLEERSIVLTPHLVAAAADDGKKPGERHVLQSGVFNAGFLALRNDASANAFIAWWSDRCYDKCVSDVENGLFVDQKWLDLVPGLFDGVHVLRNSAYNLGHWGLTHRRLEPDRDGLRVDGVPLALFHFSGLDVERPEIISLHQDRFTLDDVPPLRPLFEAYVARVMAAGFLECTSWPYAFARFSNGVPIPGYVRRLYWNLGDAARRFGNPFATRGDGSFWHWLREDAHAGSSISRFWYGLYSARPDLKAVFPDPFGKDRLEFLSWIRTDGRAEQGAPEDLVPAGPPLASAPVGRPWGKDPEAIPGVNITGDASTDGEAIRAMAGALRAAGVPSDVADIPDRPYPVNLIVAGARRLPSFIQARGPDFFRGRYNIGLWWDLAEIPEAYHGSFCYLDEVWVTTDRGLEAVARVSPIPVVKVPLPLPVDAPPPSEGARARFGLEDHHRVYLTLCDGGAAVECAHPEAAVRAFTRALPDAPEARLVVAAGHAHRRRPDADDPRVILADHALEREEVNELIALCDCYLSLDRGFGSILAEAMARGKPVVAAVADAAANPDFMSVSNGLLVRSDPDHAAEAIRLVHDDPARARALGARARADALAYASPQAVGARVAERLATLGRDVEARGSIFRG